MISHALALLASTAIASALPQTPSNTYPNTNGSTVKNGSYVLPMFDPNPAARTAELARNRAGYQYGPSLIGNSSFFLTGSLGDQLVKSEIDLWNQDAAPVREAIRAESTPVIGAIQAVSFVRMNWAAIALTLG